MVLRVWRLIGKHTRAGGTFKLNGILFHPMQKITIQSESATTEHATMQLLQAMDARAGVAVAFHLPTLRSVATDDQVRGMYFLQADVDLDAIEAIAMAPGGAAMLLRDGAVHLPPACPVAHADHPSLLDVHAPELNQLGDRGALCIGIGQIQNLPPVALALDFEDGFARGAAIFSRAPSGDGLDLLAAIGARIVKTEPLDDGRVLVHVENRLEAHLDAARLSGYRRTGNCNAFFLTQGTATGPIEDGLIEASRVRIAAGRDRLAAAVLERTAAALEEGLSLQMRAPGQDSTVPYGDLVPLGFLGAALQRIGESDGLHAPAARSMHERVLAHLEAHRTSGCWGYSTGCIPTSTDTALVAMSGVVPDFEVLDQLRGPTGGFIPQHTSSTGGDNSMKQTAAMAHWEEEDVPTTALLESLRIDVGLELVVDAKWCLARFQRWGGLYFTPPMFGLWSMANLARRLGPWEPLDDDAADADASEATARRERGELRGLIIRMLHAQFTADGGFGEFDPVLNNSLAVLACSELDVLDRAAVIGQLKLLDAWEHPRNVETPFHSTLALPRPDTFEAMMAQQHLPASGLLHDFVHQVSTYEDPHRLITSALACLALHVDADPQCMDRFLHIDHLPIIRPEAATPIEQALQHVRPYCEPSPQIQHNPSDPFCTPGRRVALLDAMTSSLDRLGPTLVSAAAAQRLHASVQSTRDDHIGAGTFGLEVRLHGGDDAIDFLWCASRSSRNLSSLLNQPDPTSRLRHLAALWTRLPDEEKPPIAFIDNIWFEFDLDASTDLPPAFFFGPSSIQRDLVDVYGLDEVAVNVRRITRSLAFEPGLNEQLLQTADRLERFDVDAAVFQTGVMFSRPETPVRICFAPLVVDKASPLLEGLGLEHMLPRCGDVLAAADACRFTMAVCVDVTPEGATSRVGFELYPADTTVSVRCGVKQPSHSVLCERLIELGYLDAARARAFLDVEGWDELSHDGGCNRRINHIKCLVNADGSIETKGYIALRRTKRPS
jgi:hypothetical protein